MPLRTHEERWKKIEEAERLGEQARQSGPYAVKQAVPPTSDFVHKLGCCIADLVAELETREQEHEEKLKYWQCKTCGYIGGNGTVEWTNEEGELCGSECPDCPSITKRAHSEELKRSFHNGMSVGRVNAESARDAELRKACKEAWNEGYRAASRDQAMYEQKGSNETTPNPHYPISQSPEA